MLRVILTIAGTIAGLAALLSFKAHGAGLPLAAAGTTTTRSGSTSSGTNSGSSSGSKGSGTSSQQAQINAIIKQQEPNVPIGPETKLAAGEKTVDGPSTMTAYGPVQVQLVERGTTVTAVRILVQPQQTLHDLQIGELAFPTLIRETIAAQNGKINSVSGATYTSGGYIKSMQAALDKKV